MTDKRSVTNGKSRRQQINVKPAPELAREKAERLKAESVFHPVYEHAILMIKRPNKMSAEEFYGVFLERAAQEVIRRFAGLDVMVLGVEGWQDMTVLNEDEMRRYGWHRDHSRDIYETWLAQVELEMRQYPEGSEERLAIEHDVAVARRIWQESLPLDDEEE